jgi:predicted GNAT superfamily acetyltransferase
MNVEIRPIRTQAEYRAVEQLQRDAWGLAEVEIVPDHLLVTAQKNGGLVLGAFNASMVAENEGLVGFVFGFAGLSPTGKVKHCSHMAAVAPAYRDQNLGYRLKLAQREQVLAQGLDLITWTFDPLESRNAALNFHKLGALCGTYVRDLYGHMRDALNVALPSDRFEVEWHIASSHVKDRIAGAGQGPSLSELQAAGIPLLNRPLPGDPPRAIDIIPPIEGERLLVEIPAYFQAIKAVDLQLARAWRLHTRALFEAAFDRTYVVTDLFFQAGHSYYLLQKDRTPE